MSFQPHDILEHQKRAGCYSLKYYQMMMYNLRHFIDDAGELAAARRRLAAALGEFDVVAEEPETHQPAPRRQKTL